MRGLVVPPGSRRVLSGAGEGDRDSCQVFLFLELQLGASEKPVFLGDGVCVSPSCLLWSSLQVKMRMKASAWEDTTSKMTTALLDAILVSCGGTDRFKGMVDGCCVEGGSPSLVQTQLLAVWF